MNPENFFQKAQEEKAVPRNAKLTNSWSFGVEPDDLADLVLGGVKTATTSAYEIYAAEKEELPKAGEYDVILDSVDEPVCVVLIDSVEVVPFSRVTAEHAYKEGEGDLALLSWQINHAKFFRKEYKQYGLIFNRNTSQVVLENFHVVYPTQN